MTSDLITQDTERPTAREVELLLSCPAEIGRVTASDLVLNRAGARIVNVARDHLRTARPIARLKQGRTDWYKLSNLANGEAELYIYDEIGYFGVTASDLVTQLAAVSAPTINVRLNSPGGDVFDGIAILNALRAHPATVNVTIDSLAASIASVIAMAGDTVTVQPGGQMMIHNAQGICIGDSADMRSLADLLDKQNANIAAIYAARAGGTADDWLSAMAAETWYSDQEAVDAGLADQVGTFGSTNSNTDSVSGTWDLSVFSYAGRDKAPAPVTPTRIAASASTADEVRKALEGAFR